MPFLKFDGCIALSVRQIPGCVGDPNFGLTELPGEPFGGDERPFRIH
jgi:hypothetical protein